MPPNLPGTREVTQSYENKVGMEIFVNNSNILNCDLYQDHHFGYSWWQSGWKHLWYGVPPPVIGNRWDLPMAFKNNLAKFFQGLFFIVSVMSEIFANISGASLIYLLWKTDFILTHGIYIIGCKVGSTIQQIKPVLSSTHINTSIIQRVRDLLF